MRRLACVACAVLAVGCASPSRGERAASSELAQMAPLERAYSGIVTGFDVRSPTTLFVSLDLQSFIGMDDDAATALKHAVVARWRRAWSAAHPQVHATLRVRFIDFIGRTIAEQSESV